MINFKCSFRKLLWVVLQINDFSIYIFIKFCVPIHSRLVNAWRNVRDAEKNFTTTFFWCKRSIPVCLTFIVGFVTLQCHFNQPRPFSHYRAKEASDFDGHRFHKMLNLRREILYYSTSVFSPILSNDKTFLVKINLYQRLT